MSATDKTIVVKVVRVEVTPLSLPQIALIIGNVLAGAIATAVAVA